MRENRGSEIVKELTGRDVPTILDPVFFLSKNEWLERIPNKREINEPYIFAYFLGATQEYRNAVKKLAHDKGMKVVALRHMDQYVEEDENFGDFAPYDVSPERFLNLLRNAEYVCTDSFHGTAFSIMFHKPFYVFGRNRHKVNSRMESLLSMFELSNRYIHSAGDYIGEQISEIDWVKIESMKSRFLNRSETFIQMALTES